jgi:hypothetical protein
MVVLLHYLSNSAVFPENYSMTSTFKKLFIASAVVLSATSFMATSAYAAGWGAIAADEVIGEKDPYYGVGGGDAKGEAEKNAMKFCKEAGGKKCEVLVTYQQCGAYAASKKYSGVGTAATKKLAEAKALSACNNSNCSIAASDCND